MRVEDMDIGIDLIDDYRHLQRWVRGIKPRGFGRIWRRRPICRPSIFHTKNHKRATYEKNLAEFHAKLHRKHQEQFRNMYKTIQSEYVLLRSLDEHTYFAHDNVLYQRIYSYSSSLYGMVVHDGFLQEFSDGTVVQRTSLLEKLGL